MSKKSATKELGKYIVLTKESFLAQVESISKPRPGETAQEFLKRKGVIK
jgi:hypothetical protein